VPLAPAWPAIFANDVLNQDYSANAPASGARRSSVLQIFATGIPAGSIVSAQIGGLRDLVFYPREKHPTSPASSR
jgi:hypothetical protein